MARGMARGGGPRPRQHASAQKRFGGGKFQSERQRRFMWAAYPSVAKAWAHNKKTAKGLWKPRVKAKAKRGRRGRRR